MLQVACNTGSACSHQEFGRILKLPREFISAVVTCYKRFAVRTVSVPWVPASLHDRQISPGVDRVVGGSSMGGGGGAWWEKLYLVSPTRLFEHAVRT